jgi:hypothetical protein
MVEFSENYGSILDCPAEFVSCGTISSVLFFSENFGNINIINTFTYISNGSCGSLKGKSQSKFVTKEFVPHFDLNDISIVFFGVVLVWIGFGTLFELNNGSERIVSPYLTGGTVR